MAPRSAIGNLATLEKLGALGPYGFLESLDYTRPAPGQPFALVETWMAHHIGMSLVALTNALTGWSMTEKDLLLAGERIQNLRAAFNRREGLAPGDFAPHPRMLGEGDGNLRSGPLKGIKVPLVELKTDYYRAMHWNPQTGHLSREHAEKLGLAQLLDGYLDA